MKHKAGGEGAERKNKIEKIECCIRKMHCEGRHYYHCRYGFIKMLTVDCRPMRGTQEHTGMVDNKSGGIINGRNRKLIAIHPFTLISII